jgi:hypothetical protein
MLSSREPFEGWEETMAVEGTEAVLAEFARTREEHLGHIIGLASIIACIPGAAHVEVNTVRGLIDEMMLHYVGAKSDTRKAARSIAEMVIRRATA